MKKSAEELFVQELEQFQVLRQKTTDKLPAYKGAPEIEEKIEDIIGLYEDGEISGARAKLERLGQLFRDSLRKYIRYGLNVRFLGEVTVLQAEKLPISAINEVNISIGQFENFLREAKPNFDVIRGMEMYAEVCRIMKKIRTDHRDKLAAQRLAAVKKPTTKQPPNHRRGRRGPWDAFRQRGTFSRRPR